MPKELRVVLDEAVKTVNLIKSRAMNARLFSILCNEMGAHFHQLLLHSEVRWLSRGKVLARLCDLLEEVLLFLAEMDSLLVKRMEDAKWVAMLAYLSDIFDRINTLNTSLEGKECHVFLAHDQVSAFRKKLDLLCARVERARWKCSQPWRMLWRRQDCNWTVYNRWSLHICRGCVSSLETILERRPWQICG